MTAPTDEQVAAGLSEALEWALYVEDCRTAMIGTGDKIPWNQRDKYRGFANALIPVIIAHMTSDASVERAGIGGLTASGIDDGRSTAEIEAAVAEYKKGGRLVEQYAVMVRAAILAALEIEGHD